MAEQMDCLEKQYDYNATRPHEQERRAALLREMFAQIGENCYIEPPLHANWGGRHVHFGSGVYANFNLTLVDDAHIYVGDCVVFGPNVTVATAGHPIEPGLRRQAMQYNADVRIGSNVWVGAGAVILPGVTIGDDTVIGAGSVVTKDIPGGRGSRGLPWPVCCVPSARRTGRPTSGAGRSTCRWNSGGAASGTEGKACQSGKGISDPAGPGKGAARVFNAYDHRQSVPAALHDDGFCYCGPGCG